MASSLLAEAKLLERYGGLRPDRDVLVFDPVHCYGLPRYLQIVDHFVSNGWRRDAFWPHGGHLFSLHVVSALGLGGAEVARSHSVRSTGWRTANRSMPATRPCRRRWTSASSFMPMRTVRFAR
ncbi:hypothetical protein WI69_23935 [Burkholderia diffusa]|nr:hypothetical protein WI28_19075 [Burkholderia diffusa]KVC13149.1 hypothetical protein WI69_23935 [Burkholderia diffusa]